MVLGWVHYAVRHRRCRSPQRSHYRHRSRCGTDSADYWLLKFGQRRSVGRQIRIELTLLFNHIEGVHFISRCFVIRNDAIIMLASGSFSSFTVSGSNRISMNSSNEQTTLMECVVQWEQIVWINVQRDANWSWSEHENISKIDFTNFPELSTKSFQFSSCSNESFNSALLTFWTEFSFTCTIFAA